MMRVLPFLLLLVGLAIASGCRDAFSSGQSPVASDSAKDPAPTPSASSEGQTPAAPFSLQPLPLPELADGPRRLSVMFFGAPTANGPHHDPITRYRVLKKAVGVAGIDLTYVEDPAVAFAAETLAGFDAVLMYGNWNQRTAMKRAQLRELLRFVDEGGGFLPIHCASACFGGSPLFIKLVGARFLKHGGEEFEVTNAKPAHEILDGLAGFKAWDETYVHDSHGEDREILQTRDGEPWTWTRTHGSGRVFYTASGHDHRVWDRPEFLQLLERAIFWAVGEDRRAQLRAFDLPQLETERVSLPGYRERKEISVAQKPLPPEQSQKLVQVPVGMSCSLFASEPDIVNPIHVNWDHRGRAFVIETVDYPNNLAADNLGHDRITICEDTDGDGRADRFVRFAEGLSIPTSLAFADGGVICTNGSQMLFLRDEDGDDRADVRRVLFDGFGMGDTHAGVSNLRQGADGWTYATVGYSGFRGTVGGQRHQFSQGLFRFRADGTELEFLQNTTNNTWGLGFTESFDVVGSTANGNPSWYLSFPRAHYARVSLDQGRTPQADDNPKFFPMSQDIRQVDQFDRYTAGAGHAIYTARRFPAAYQDRIAFVCGPTGKLVGQFAMHREGAGFRAEQLPNNLFASADAWSSPVCCEVGPDGAVWICDWYNLIIQHNPTPSLRSAGIAAKTGRGNAYMTPLRDRQHGRIYRVVPTGSQDDAAPKLDPEDAESLLAGLSHPNMLWRGHAQRLLIELGSEDEGVIEQLEELVGSASVASPYALHVLDQLSLTSVEVLHAALTSTDPTTRRAAVSIATPDDLKRVFVEDGAIRALGRELAEVLVGLSQAAADPDIAAAIYSVARHVGDAMFEEPALRDAWHMAARSQAGLVLAAARADGALQDDTGKAQNLLQNPGFEEVAEEVPKAWTDLRTYGGAPPGKVTVRTSDAGRNGGRCLEVRCDEFTDSGVAMQLSLEAGARYRLSGWVRTEGAVPAGRAPGMMLNIHGGPRTRGLVGTTEWTELSLEFDARSGETIVHCLFGGYGGAKGAAFYDDLSLVKLGGGQTVAGALKSLAAFHTSDGVAAAPIVRKHEPDPAVHALGDQVFRATCIACHGFDGEGVPGAFPPLNRSDWLTGDAELPIRIVLHGLSGPVTVNGKHYQNAMAPLGATLDDAQIAAVLTYVRQSWRNDAKAISAAQVAKVRAAHRERSALWTAAELGR